MNRYTRMVYVSYPLPLGVFGGGAVCTVDGYEIPVVVTSIHGGLMDRRKFKRLQRRARAAPPQDASQ